MAKAVFDELKKDKPKSRFTVGINDDVSHTSLEYDADFNIDPPGVQSAIFYGLGSDGTVGANKNTIKIIGEDPAFYAQGYFVYDYKKSGSQTVSHLRFGADPIKSPYLIHGANFIACHTDTFLETTDMLANAQPGATFLLNTTHGPDAIWNILPYNAQKTLIEKRMKLYVMMPTGWPRTPGWAAASTPSCKPASLRCPVF